MRVVVPASLLAAVLVAAMESLHAGTEDANPAAAITRLAGAGLSAVLPRGWHGRIVRSAGSHDPYPTLEAANFRLPRKFDRWIGEGSSTSPRHAQVRLLLAEGGNPPGRHFPPTRHLGPLSGADFACRTPVPANHACAGRRFSHGGRSFSLIVEFGYRPAPGQLLRATDKLIASIRIKPHPWARPGFWRPFHRPLRLATLADRGRCPVSATAAHIPRVAIALGRGPAYSVLGSDTGADLSGEIVKDGWHYHKTLWAFAPSYRGPLLIRGRRLDATGSVRFAVGARPAVELRVPPTSRREWRYLPSDTLFPGEGCYGFQVDGRAFTETIVFRAFTSPT
jgi:hypothetical protein